MPRPRNVVRTIPVHLLIEEPLMARVYAVIHSELEGRVPYGAQQAFFTRAAEMLLDHLATEAKNAVL